MVRACKVSDLPYTGNNMNWFGKRQKYTVECWLDRLMVNDEWKVTYLTSEVEYLELIESGHRPTIIKIRKDTYFGPKPFYFDASLCNRLEMEDIVKDCWPGQSPYDIERTVYEKIKGSISHISKWRRENNTNSATHKRIKGLY